MPKTATNTDTMQKQKCKRAAQPEDDQNQIASPKQLRGILTAEIDDTRGPRSTKDEFMDTGIIAERRYIEGRKKHENVDFLVEGLPVWRRHGSENGVDRNHLKAWEKLNSDETNVVQADVKRYKVTMHRTHPLFERWTGAKEIFENGLIEANPAPQTRKAGDVDNRDRAEAFEMLGHMIDKCLDETVERGNILNDLTKEVFSRAERNNVRDATAQAGEFVIQGRRFLAKSSLGQRQDLAAILVTDGQAPNFHSWTIALCIATLPMAKFLDLWQENTAIISREHARENRLMAYRLAISTFLDEYHNKTRPGRGFIYTLRTYSTLSEMLRTEPPETFGAEEALRHGQEQDGDNENDDGGVAPEPAHHGVDEGAVTREPAALDNQGEEEADEEELETQEKEIQEIEEAAAREAAKPVPGKTRMRLRKRKNEDTAALGAGTERGEKRTKSRGGLTVRPH